MFYFQVPQYVMESSMWRKLKPVSKSLYIYLLFVAQSKSRPIFTLTSKEIQTATGLSVNAVTAAKKQLRGKLVSIVDKGTSGSEYEILDPYTGKQLEKVRNFDKLSAEQIRDYFLHHVSEFDPESEIDSEGYELLRFRCPFHSSTRPHKARMGRDETIAVKLSQGAPWRCDGERNCGRRGKLVAFEMAMAERRGMPLTSTEAHHAVKRILVRTGNMRANKQARKMEAARRSL